MFGYASDVIGMADLSEEQHAQFAEFCDGAVATVAWTSPAFGDDGAIVVHEAADESGEWQEDDGDIQDVVRTANLEEWSGFFVENYADLVSCSADFVRHGHDYVLTAGFHGAGFWDRGYAKGVADRLTDSAQGGTGSHWFWFEANDAAEDGLEALHYEQV